MSTISLFAENEREGRREITDLYWFEEEGIHDWSGKGHWGVGYKLTAFVDGVQVWSNDTEPLEKEWDEDGLTQLRQLE